MSARADIENCLYRYAWAFDMDRLTRLAECFTEDIATHFTSGLVVGRPEVLADLEERRAVFRRDDVVPWHLINNVLIAQHSEDEARVQSFFTFFIRRGAAPPEPSTLGYYEDTFVRDGSAWRISIRRVVSGGTYRSDLDLA